MTDDARHAERYASESFAGMRDALRSHVDPDDDDDFDSDLDSVPEPTPIHVPAKDDDQTT